MTTAEGPDRKRRDEDAEHRSEEQPPRPPSAVVSHRPEASADQARTYWTPERRRAAEPRRLMRDRTPETPPDDEQD